MGFWNRCFRCSERLVSYTKFQIFVQNHGLTPVEKYQFCGFFKPMFSLSRKACLLYKTSKILFSIVIFTIYDMGIQRVKRGYMALLGVTGGYKSLQGVTRGDRWWQGVTGGDKGLHGVTKDYRNFFLTRTLSDTFSWSILHKNQRRRNLKFLTKTME